MKFLIKALLLISGIIFISEVEAEDFTSISKKYGRAKAIKNGC